MSRYTKTPEECAHDRKDFVEEDSKGKKHSTDNAVQKRWMQGAYIGLMSSCMITSPTSPAAAFPRARYTLPCQPQVCPGLAHQATVLGGCTFDEGSDPSLCEYSQGEEDDFDWQLVKTYPAPHSTSDLLPGVSSCEEEDSSGVRAGLSLWCPKRE
ncbi:UNVERIFIED_CONTAM: hypothetical protein FKN15_014175 [Acipenser sinensis]